MCDTAIVLVLTSESWCKASSGTYVKSPVWMKKG